jgi:sulfide:quinone oxidoreductase
MARIVVLGAGFAGIAAAIRLARAAKDRHEVVLLDRGDTFRMGLAKLWVLVGRRPLAEGRGELTRLERHGLSFRKTFAGSVETKERTVLTSEGPVPYDALLICPGAETQPEAVPGLPADANLYDWERIPRLRDRLAGMRRGRIAIVIVRPPYKCPPAPYECALILDHALRRRGVRDAFDLAVYIPEPAPLTVAGPEAGAKVAELLAARGIRLEVNLTLERVHAHAPDNGGNEGGKLSFAGGQEREYDLLLAVPRHVPPPAVQIAGLTDDSGWVPVDPVTCATAVDRVWAAGDVTGIRLPGGGLLPKAGLFAEKQGRAAADGILAALDGRGEGGAFDGTGECFFETGEESAMLVKGAFYGDPKSRVTISDPSPDAYRAKLAFERDRLAEWFGIL